MKNEGGNLFEDGNYSKNQAVFSKEERMGLVAKGMPQFEKVMAKELKFFHKLSTSCIQILVTHSIDLDKIGIVRYFKTLYTVSELK